ncbi:hypothetical protein PFISCL1PPCAC_19671 [Pristionchus fissidentatus]|uniref:RRM domain-containing protein n=1 Tax=Pristionchus fissidentatus TaxID=1538716 RepID=A0AAV5WEY9_9BILA|nr:hypothetical protein PFISCL1PPCAC_19671 [Pristionchus fissidentatus]
MSVIIRLQGLPLSASSGDIRNFFSGLLIPDGAVNIVGGDDGDAFIGFATDEDARQAMRKNNGLIHNAEIRLFLSSRTEMKEVIDNARAASSAPPPSTNPPHNRFGGVPPRFEKNEQSRFGRQEPSKYGREEPPRFSGEEAPRVVNNEPPRYGRDVPPMAGSGGPPAFPQTGLPIGNRMGFNGREEERGGGRQSMMRPNFEMERPSFPPRELDQRKSDNGLNNRDYGRGLWQNRDGNSIGDMRQQNANGMNVQQSMKGRIETERSAPMPTRELGYGIFGGGREEMDESRKDNNKKEESWRKENNRSFDSNVSSLGAPMMPPPSTKPDQSDSISFFGRGPSPVKRSGILPPPIPPPSLSAIRVPPAPLPIPTQQPKEEAFVELTRLPPDLLRPSSLEQFLSPSTPLTLSSVKVVYGPAGIHLQSLVRFTSAMDAISALKKDGEQGVKIRVSTKEAFDGARDGPPPIIPPMHGMPPSMMDMGQMMGMTRPLIPHNNLLNMPLINPHEMPMSGEKRRGSPGRDRGDRRRREESPPRRDERRRRSPSPRSKRPRPPRGICVRISNVHFRAKETEIRRMLGHSINPFSIKKVFNEDNSPSDVWVLEFSTEDDVSRALHSKFEMLGRIARMVRIEEPEADRLLRQKFRSPPPRKERERDDERRGEERRSDSFEEKVKRQQRAIEMENSSQIRDRRDSPPSLAGAFSAPVFTTNRGFMRGGRGGGRGMRGEFRGGMRGRGGRGPMAGGMMRGTDRNCLLVSNMPLLPSPQILLEHLRVDPSSFVKCDQIAPDAAIVEIRSCEEAVRLAERAASDSFPHLNGRRLIVAAMSRRQIEDEFNLRGGGRKEGGGDMMHQNGPRINVDPEIVRSIGEPGCVVACNGFPRDLAIDEVAAFFDGFPIIESSVRMRMEGGEGTGDCMLSMRDGQSARRAVMALNGKSFRGAPVALYHL